MLHLDSRDRRVGGTLAQLLAPSSVGEGGPEPHLTIHGANLEMQSGALQEHIRELLDRGGRAASVMGRYDWRQLDRLMESVDWVVIPSIWWENAPLVIQEAFFHGRPVICSDIGGMAEKVTHGVDGLHFRARDPRMLAEALREAASTPGLWHRLREGIRPVYRVDQHRERLSSLYDTLLARRSAPEVGLHVG